MQKKYIKNIITIFILIIFLELTVFNINSYRVLNSEKSIKFEANDFNYIENDDDVTYIKIQDVNTEVKTIHIEISNRENIEYEFLYTDETSTDLRNTPAKKYIQDLENSKYMATFLSGKSKDIGVRIASKDANVQFVIINDKIPFHFSLQRVLILFGIITLIYAIRNFEIFNISYSKKSFKQELILLMILGVFFCLIYFINDYSKDEIYDFYCVDFVKALSNGNFYLEKLPNETLINMENPYDLTARNEMELIRDRDYIWDAALFDGKMYVYFGILPVLVLFLPYYIITGEFLYSSTGVLIFSILAAVGIKALVEIVFIRFFKDIKFKNVVFSLIIMLFGSQILVLNGIPRFYEVPIIAGLFFSITGIDFILMSVYGKKISYVKMLIGSLFLALAVACRPTQLFTSLIILPILLKKFIENVKEKKDIIKNIIAVAVPYLTVGVLLMYYNYARFGSIFEFGSKYQLTINDMRHLSNRFASLWTGIICSLFSIPRFLPAFPFLTSHNYLTPFYGYYYIENMLGGLFILVPVCFGIFKLPIVLKKSENKELKSLIISFTIVGFFICFLSIVEAGSMQRYIVDYGWMLILAGLCTILELQNIYKSDEAKHILKNILAVLTIYIVFVNFCCGIVSEKYYLGNNSPEVYYEMKYTIDFWE